MSGDVGLIQNVRLMRNVVTGLAACIVYEVSLPPLNQVTTVTRTCTLHAVSMFPTTFLCWILLFPVIAVCVDIYQWSKLSDSELGGVCILFTQSPAANLSTFPVNVNEGTTHSDFLPFS